MSSTSSLLYHIFGVFGSIVFISRLLEKHREHRRDEHQPVKEPEDHGQREDLEQGSCYPVPKKVADSSQVFLYQTGSKQLRIQNQLFFWVQYSNRPDLKEHSKHVRRRRRKQHQRQKSRESSVQDGRADVHERRPRPAQVPGGLGELVGLCDVGL